jgi:carboxyl-terminal processing protease
VTLASPISLADIGESSLDDALPWDRIQAAGFGQPGQLAPSIAKLVTEENARQRRDPDYRWWLADIAAVEKLRSQKSLSLNIETRKADRAALETERLARENDRRAARQQPVLKSISELDSAELPDVILDQAVQVAGDMVQFGSPLAARRQ